MILKSEWIEGGCPFVYVDRGHCWHTTRWGIYWSEDSPPKEINLHQTTSIEGLLQLDCIHSNSITLINSVCSKSPTVHLKHTPLTLREQFASPVHQIMHALSLYQPPKSFNTVIVLSQPVRSILACVVFVIWLPSKIVANSSTRVSTLVMHSY